MLRDYQVNAIELVRARAKDRPLLCLPTGAGKTSVAAEIIRRATERGRRSIFLVHRRELVDQAVDRLAQFGVKAGRIVAGHPETLGRSVQVASIPTLIRREHWPADVVIVDECAHAVSASWKKCLDRYPPPALTIGLTATPIRLDGRGLGDLFGCIIEPVTTVELIERGFLVNPTVFAPPIDLHDIKIRAGDYSLPELAEKMTKLVGSITGTWQQRAPGQSTVAFAVNIEHSQAIVAAFQELGVAAEHLDYAMPHKKRARILRDLRDGRLTMVSQVQLLSEGWDLPTLRCAILARPTKSLALYRQMVGRVMRPPGPVIVLDHAGNTHEHGLVTDRIEWSLDDAAKRPRSAAPAVRTCKECFAVIPPLAESCPACGAPLPVRDEADAPKVENPGELVELVMDRPWLNRNVPMGEKQEQYRRWLHEAVAHRRDVGWARQMYRDKFGVWPRLGAIERAEYVCRGHSWKLAVTGPRSEMRCERCLRYQRDLVGVAT